MPKFEIASSSASLATPLARNEPPLPPEAPSPKSALAGHAKAEGSATGARAGLLNQIGGLIRKLLNRICCVAPAPTTARARTANTQYSLIESARKRYDEALASLPDALTRPHATPISIWNALAEVVKPARALHKAGLSEETGWQALRQRLRVSDKADLVRLAAAYGKPRTRYVIDTAAGQSSFETLLNRLKQEIKDELVRRAERGLSMHLLQGSSEFFSLARTQQLTRRQHGALEDLEKDVQELKALGMLPPNTDVAAQSARMTLEHLASLGAGLSNCLRTLPLDDLLRLRRYEKNPDAPGLKAVNATIAGEIAQWPARRAAEFAGLVETFQNRYPEAGADIPREQFLDEVVALAEEYDTVRAGFRATGQPIPDELSACAERIRARSDQLYDAQRIPLDNLTAARVALLKGAFACFGEGTVSAALDGRRANQIEAARHKQQSVAGNLIDQLAFHGVAVTHEVLERVEALVQASIGLREVTEAFAEPETSLGKDESYALSHAVAKLPLTAESDGGIDHLERARENRPKERFDRLLGEKDFQALVSALHVGADLAFKQQQGQASELGNRLMHMANSLERLADSCGARMALPPSAADRAAATARGDDRASPSLRTHQHYAAANLSEPANEALLARYGLKVPRQASAAAQRQMNEKQTQILKDKLEEPLSQTETAVEKTQDGKHQVGKNFYKDATRETTYRVKAAQGPSSNEASLLIDTRDWPVDESGRAQRVSAGFERLIEFCGGNEKQARTLTLFAHQGMVAGFHQVVIGPDSPLRLPDGTAGSMLLNEHGGGGGSDRHEFTFVMGENGRPRIEVDYTQEGRNFFYTTEGEMIVLSPESYARVQFSAELVDGPDGTPRLALLEPPTYDYDLKPDSYTKHYDRPTVQALRAAPEGHDLPTDAREYARRVDNEYELRALEAIDAFHTMPQPTLLAAAKVFATCDSNEEGREIVSSSARATFEREMVNAVADLYAAFAQAGNEAIQMAGEVYRQDLQAIVVRPDWPIGYPAPEKLSTLLDALERNESNQQDLLAVEAVRAHIRESSSPEIVLFMDERRLLHDEPGQSAFEHAEKIFNRYIAQPKTGSPSVTDDPAPLNLESGVEQRIRRLLDQARNRPFDRAILEQAREELESRVQRDILQPMIASVERGMP